MPSGKRLPRDRKVPLSQRRTRKLEDAKEVLVSTSPDGPIHTTAGELRMTEEDQGQLQQNTRDHLNHALVRKLANGVMECAEKFFEAQTYKYVPTEVIVKGEQAVAEYFMANGFSFIQDGFTSVVKQRGTVLQSSEFPVLPRYQKAVKQELARLTQ